MAHDITQRANGFAEMAFTGTTPWHGLGQRVTEGATIEEWQTAAGLDWQAIEAPVQYQMGEGGRTMAYPEKKVLYRNDTGAPLSVVGDGYKTVQPAEVLEFFRDMADSWQWTIHTAGSLKGGRKIWALARNHTEGDVTPGDRVRGNLLLATSLDGSLATVAAMTAIRVVCANTLRLALADTAGKRVRVSHRSVFDADAAKSAVGVARESFDQFMERARRMAETPCHVNEARDILRQLFGQPARINPAEPVTMGGTIDGSEFAQLLTRPLASDAAVREQRSVPKVLDLFNGKARGADHLGSAGTRWGLFNAITEHVDHQLGRTADSRFDSALFGKGHEVKTQALDMLAPIVGA